MLKFKPEDFEEYKSWYKDVNLAKELGPMDKEWLNAVLKEKDGQEYSAFNKENLVAVVGIKFPNTEHPYYFITDIAVKPSLKNQRIGSQVLQKLIELHTLKHVRSWQTVVNVRNVEAKLFLERNGWICKTEVPDEHGMITFELYKR